MIKDLNQKFANFTREVVDAYGRTCRTCYQRRESFYNKLKEKSASKGTETITIEEKCHEE
jgi:hypothetical protein